MTQDSLVPSHWLHLQRACFRHQANLLVATFIAKELLTIAQIKNISRFSNCGRRGNYKLFNSASYERTDVFSSSVGLCST